MSIKKVNNKVDFIHEEHNVLDFWKKNNIQSVHLSITGIDLNFSRVENAKNGN